MALSLLCLVETEPTKGGAHVNAVGELARETQSSQPVFFRMSRPDPVPDCWWQKELRTAFSPWLWP